MMKKSLPLATIFLLIIVLLTGGCTGHPKGMTSLRHLTDAEKEKVIEIALTTPEALDLQVKEKRYETRLKWGAINWLDHKETYSFDYESVDKGIPANIPDSAELYSVVEVYIAAPTYFPGVLLVAYINPVTGKVALVSSFGLKKLPTAP